MKIKLFPLLILFILVLAASVYADDGDIYNDGYWRTTSTGVQRPITLTTGGQMTPVEVGVSGDTLTAAETGKTYILRDVAGGANVIFTLPSATVGLRYTFVADKASYINVKPAATDTIVYSTLVAGNAIRSTATVADSVTLICVTEGYWSVEAMKGTWVNGY